MKPNYVKQGLAVAVILLFLGVALAPTITANAVEELVEVEVEFCGLDKDKHTVKLTEQEALELELLFDSIKTQLDGVETREETIQVFNDAVEKLDKYGLLGELSVQDARLLVTGLYTETKLPNLLDKYNEQLKTPYLDQENYLCLIAGLTTSTLFRGPIYNGISRISGYFTMLCQIFGDYISDNNLWFLLPFVILGLPLYTIMLLTWFITEQGLTGAILSHLSPIRLGSSIGIGCGIYSMYREILIPGKGWIYSLGTNGVVKHNGTFFGNLSLYLPDSEVLFLFSMAFFVRAVAGFIGLKISIPVLGSFYFGSALKVKIMEV